MLMLTYASCSLICGCANFYNDTLLKTAACAMVVVKSFSSTSWQNLLILFDSGQDIVIGILVFTSI